VAKIFYAMSGEGRGHATRVRTVVEMLRPSHDLTLFAYGDALHFLAPIYEGTAVRVRPIEGMRFRYAMGRTDYVGTALAGFRFCARTFRRQVAELEDLIRREKPDLVLTDFEPTLPRAARRAGVAVVSLDHQHFLAVSDLAALPPGLRFCARLLGAFVRGYIRGQAFSVVSSFYAPPLRRTSEGKAVQIGALLRPEVLAEKPERCGHLAAYLRRPASDRLLESLARCGLPIRIYGQGVRCRRGSATFHDISPFGFLKDLATSEALVCSAGNQIVGEAFHLGKPVLAIPEPGNWEQSINGHFVSLSGCGEQAAAHSLTPARLEEFLDRMEMYRASLLWAPASGNSKVVKALSPFLEADPASRRSSPPDICEGSL
jgi:uncharacterized protein (TIGR00661 family)